MSHFSKIKTSLRDLALLQKSLDDLGVRWDENIKSLVNDFVSFIGWFNNKYLEYKSTENVLVKELLVSIWSYAFDELSKGKSISEIIISSYEVDQVKALELYHLIVLNN